VKSYSIENNLVMVNNAYETGKRCYTYNHIPKANLSWSPTWAKFCLLIISIVLPQLHLTKLKLYL